MNETRSMAIADTARAPRAPRLRCLEPGVAAFVEAAFERILPAAEGGSPRAAAYVDHKLCEPSNASVLRLYRAGIAEVQAYCTRAFKRRFEALAVCNQLAVLHRSKSPAAPRQPSWPLFYQLVNDAAEAYFERAPVHARGFIDEHVFGDPRGRARFRCVRPVAA